MSIHSIKVCRLYKITASIIKEVTESGGSVKELIYEKKHPNIKAIYALVNETLRHAAILDELFNATQILIKEPRFDPWLARVLITELLWGKKKLSGEAKPIQTALSYQKELNDCLLNISLENEVSENKVIKPRYVRVNTLLISVNDVINAFVNEGWNFIQNTHNDYNNFLSLILSLQKGQFTADLHIPDLLIFPPNTQFYNCKHYLNGSLILQDKASCLPVLFLNPEPNSNVLDMCAAPGMKTTQLAAAMNNQGVLYAVEKDKHRYQTLCTLIEKAKASCVKPINENVFHLTGQEYNNIEYILVDPSCSGSGMTDRIKVIHFEENYSEARLKKISLFQTKVLCYALTNFPNVKRVVYSTCSIFPQENEEVVEMALKKCKGFELVNAKKLLGDKWNNTGAEKYIHIGSNCVYSYSDSDYTNGFFVAVFEKCEISENVQANTLKRKNDKIKQKVILKKRIKQV